MTSKDTIETDLEVLEGYPDTPIDEANYMPRRNNGEDIYRNEVVDKKHEITGSGTKDDPYQIVDSKSSGAHGRSESLEEFINRVARHHLWRHPKLLFKETQVISVRYLDTNYDVWPSLLNSRHQEDGKGPAAPQHRFGS